MKLLLILLLVCTNVYAISPDDLLEQKRDVAKQSPEDLVYEFNQYSAGVNEKDGLSEIENKYFERMKEIDNQLTAIESAVAGEVS